MLVPKFRKATIDDLTLLTQLRMEFLIEANGSRSKFENKLSIEIAEYYRRHIPDESFIAWLGVCGDQIVATSGISFYEVPPSHSNINGKVGYIMNMYTKKEFRRMGMATSLFKVMLEEGKRNNVGKFVLHATMDGKELYKKFGFILSGDEMIATVDWS
jgi:GNAT superfamily N-acetyltransferase